MVSSRKDLLLPNEVSSKSKTLVNLESLCCKKEMLLFFLDLRRASRQKQSSRCVLQKGLLRNFAKFTGKHLYQILSFNKVAGLKTATLLKKKPWHRYFPVNFAKFRRAPFSIEHLWWLSLNLSS